MAVRLACILRELRRIIAEEKPDVAAIEVIFMHRSSVSALTLGQARGVALAALAESGLAVHEYNASTVKQSVTGSGKADKAQIERMVGMLLGADAEGATTADARDACAIAMTHHLHAGRIAAVAGLAPASAPNGANRAPRARKLDPRNPASWGVTMPEVKPSSALAAVVASRSKR